MDHTDTSHDLTRVASTMSSLHPYAGTTASGSGRRSELAVIREHAERLATGNGALVMWFGPRGAGKTRLLHEATNVVTEVLPHVRTLHIPGDSLRTSTLAGVAGMLAHALDLKVVAEGVETREQADLLARLACDEVQGYLYGRPVPAHDIVAALPQEGGAPPGPD